MNIYTLDFETYYDKEYSLKNMTTEEYIRDKRFEAIGVSVQVNDGGPTWFSGTHSEIKSFLDAFDISNNLALAHNAVFDAAILGWHFGIQPRGWLDTLSMARAVHGTEVGGSLAALSTHYGVGTKGDEVVRAEGKRRVDFNPFDLAQYGLYCSNDVALTYAIFQEMAKNFPKAELRLIDLTVRMFSEPALRLNKEVLLGHQEFIQRSKRELMQELVLRGYSQADLMSSNKFAELLAYKGVSPPTKISPATGKQTYAFSKTDEEFTRLLEHADPFVRNLVAARLGVKSTLEETRTQRLLDISSRGALPVPLRYYAAHTGRWGGDDKINLQNIPRVSPLNWAMEAPEGYVICDSDSSQIEARVLAWLAGQDDLVKAFEDGRDVYVMMASRIYTLPEPDIKQDQRFVGKQTILGSGYGMGPPKFVTQLKNFGVNISLDDATHIIGTYRATNSKIPLLWKAAREALDWIINDQTGEFGRGGLLKVDGKKGIRLPNGMYLRYPNLRKQVNPDTGSSEYVYDIKKGKSATSITRIYGGKVVENVCQALARIIIGDQMLSIARKYTVVMTVHDAIASLIPAEEAETGAEFVQLCMRMRPRWAPDLPLNCEVGYGKSLGDC